MILESQTDIIAALSDPTTYGTDIDHVDVCQSHISILFLAGDKAYKLKRAVLYSEADFSTPEKRRLSCVREMKRSTIYAPGLITDVKPIRRLKNGRIVIGGKNGTEIDTVLEMRRIPRENLLNNLLPSPTFDRFEAMDLAESLAELHNRAQVFKTKWGTDTVKKIILENESILSCFCPDLFTKEAINTLTRQTLSMLGQTAALIRYRQKTGHVRKCHGDLLLSNIAHHENRFWFFSPIEYNETQSCIDTLYDLADLMMDLEAKGLRRLTNILFNHYMAYTNDIDGFPLLPLYQSIRAAGRAAVCAKRSTLLKGADKKAVIKEARRYFHLATCFITEFHPVLIACGGLSGSGKSRVARDLGGMLSPAPGAVILRDDVVKKQIVGLLPHQPLDDQYNTPAFEEVVYDVLRQEARTALGTGSCVIIDALFYNPTERQAVENLAKELNLPFVGFWMDAPLAVRAERVEKRLRNPSDVHSSEELQKQLHLETGRISWHKIMTDGAREKTTEQALRILKKEIKEVKK